MPLFSRYPQMRAWPEFFDTSKFESPKNPQERLSTNLSYFAGNYIAIFAVLFAFTCLLNIFLLFGLLIAIGGGYGFKMYAKQQFEIAEQVSKSQKRKQLKLNKEYAFYYCYAALFVICLFGNVPLFSCVAVTLFLVLAHALLRKRSIKSNLVHFVDVYKDFGPISSLAEYISNFVEDNNNNNTSK
mmetsp:Transcript_12893/g.19567  ORF Transcript_12893/g.19567 Transcript_12893/m.19567 type:complete len:185 (-) Transcript_12893:166-720(-)|eukprot:CAMPEP_0202707202 /NCGR_PEP_ID=MMETSP1385-20130828/19540_1 /ASSEMBLY_ACC=CAM_ASM_000861 /TAXON_ID=933848 /ORGANISM="Elphidium margaritaceum" /LENGTH=184 /DNA_ID=CAMNT_0049365855 /DNA_START=89 /DNA_END=643 /DNA_ORIENTATION=-